MVGRLSGRVVAAATAVLTGLALSACATDTRDTPDSPDRLVFAVTPSESSTSITENFTPVVEVLADELGVEVELRHMTSYAALIEAQQAGQVDIASYGPFAYVSAVDSGVDITAVATGAASPDDTAVYRSYGIVPAGSGLRELADFADRTICFVDPTSTSGYLYPAAGLIEAGVDPVEDLTPLFLGTHDAVTLAVADGTCEGGFAHDTMVDRALVDAGALSTGEVEAIWRSGGIPSTPVVVHNHLGGRMVERVRDILVTHANRDALTGTGYCDSVADCPLPKDMWGFIPVDDSSYDDIRRVCELTDAEACVN